MADFEFYIDIENSSGVRQGGGPITSADQWQYTARMDRAGTFAFTMPASDAMAAEVTKKRIVRAWARLNSTWTEVGAGIIDNIVKQQQADGTVTLSVSGDSEERELTYRSVGFLQLEAAGAAISHATALSEIDDYAPSGWTFTADSAPTNNSIYGRFAGESVLQALVKLAEKSQDHFYRSGSKAVTFASTFANSGVRAIQANGDLVSETCAIVSLQERVDTYDMISRIYPYGAGTGKARLTLAATNLSAASGYTLDKTNNYLKHDATESTYGRIERYIEYKDVAPVSNTDADLRAAANMLFQQTYRDLRWRALVQNHATYSVQLAQCSRLLKPMQSIRVVYRDVASSTDIDEDLNILESTIEVDASGVRTTGLVVSNWDFWPRTDSDVIADSMESGSIFQAHPQMNANSYTTGYTKNVDEDYNAVMRFWLGSEVVQVNQIVLDFQLLPFESTVKTIASATGTTTIVTELGGSGNTGSVALGETGIGGGASTGAKAPDTGVKAPDTGYGGGANTGGAALTTSGTSLTTGSPTGGDVVSGGRHNHGLAVEGRTTFDTNWKSLYYDPSANAIIAHSSSYNPGLLSESSGTHTHAVDSHSHTTASHTHTIATHSHTTASHTHTTASHSHTTASHSHTTASHSHTTASHSHTVADHTHDLSDSLSAQYGIYREDASITYQITDLEYRVNSSAWADLSDDATDAGSDWWHLDITAYAVDSDTLRPNQAANTIEIRDSAASAVAMACDVTGGSFIIFDTSLSSVVAIGDKIVVAGTTNYNGTYTVDAVNAIIGIITLAGIVADNGTQTGTAKILKTATIDALLSVRNIVQAISYT